MFIVADEKTHVGATPPEDLTLLWIESNVVSSECVTDVLSNSSRFDLTNATISQLLTVKELISCQLALTIYEIVETDASSIVVKRFNEISNSWSDVTNTVTYKFSVVDNLLLVESTKELEVSNEIVTFPEDANIVVNNTTLIL